MEYAEMYEATKAAFLDAMAESKKQPRMMAISPFDAEDDAGDPVRVVGVIDEEDGMRFIVIEEESDGSIIPIARTSIFRRGAAHITSEE